MVKITNVGQFNFSQYKTKFLKLNHLDTEKSRKCERKTFWNTVPLLIEEVRERESSEVGHPAGSVRASIVERANRPSHKQEESDMTLYCHYVYAESNFRRFDAFLTVYLSIFILVINQIDAQKLVLK